MAKNNEVDRLKAVIKAKDKIIKELSKCVNRKSKREHLYNDLEEKQQEIQAEKDEVERAIVRGELCPKCSSQLEYVELGPKRRLVKCTNNKCTYKKSYNK